MNSHSLGIELDNAGRLTRSGSHWRGWFGDPYPDDDVIQAVHKFETESCGWQNYTPEQMSAALLVAGLLMADYNLLDVVGHEDIAPHRKCDPGPAFPIASFRSRLLGRREDQVPQYKTTTKLNIRSGPGTQNPALAGGPLPQGTTVQQISVDGAWCKVDVQGATGQLAGLEGWVKSQYLERLTEPA